MIVTTVATLISEGFVLERGEGQRLQLWRRVTSAGVDACVIHDVVSGRTFSVVDDGRMATVLVACATVVLAAVEASSLPAAVKAAQAQIILDALGAI